MNRAKKDIAERDLHRFKQEFEVLKRISFPYIVEVYQYDETHNEYKMKHWDETLRDYIAKRNNRLSFVSRKRIALQNVMLKVLGDGAVLVKLSDFGLVKDHNSEFTRTKTEMRGTIRDPLLSSFKDYTVLNEIYSIGWALSYIFSSRQALKTGTDEVSRIVQKCGANDTAQRYQWVIDFIADVQRLEASPTNNRTLFTAAADAGVQRVVHVSISPMRSSGRRSFSATTACS